MISERTERLILIALTAGIAAVVGWSFYQNVYRHRARGGADYTRRVSDSAVYGAALDNSLGQVTPNHLAWFGPTMRPPHWRPHRVTYPQTPGVELERLCYGAPGSYNVVTPAAQRGWLFNPPSEVDI